VTDNFSDMQIDINALHEPHKHKSEPEFRPLRICLTVIAILALGSVAIAIPVAASAWRMVNEAESGRAALVSAASAAQQLDFPDAAVDLRRARMHLASADRFGVVLAPFAAFPYVGADIAGARTLVHSSYQTATALERVATLGESILNVLSKTGGLDAKTPTVSGGVIAFFRLPAADRHAVLGQLNQVPADFGASVTEIDQALAGFDSLSSSDYLAPTVASLKPIIVELKNIRDRLAAAGDLAKLLPALSGYPEAKNYLLLLQNNTELRPTGGFIGTLGTVTIADATASALQVNDVYAFDSVSSKLPTPPAPLAKYLSADKWYLRDANWSPDFPTAARQVISTYAAEGGTAKFDGVLAVDPTLAADLLKIVGNITIGSSTFTPSNVTDEIEFQVEKGFNSKGLPVAQRKDILIALVDQVFARTLALPADRWQGIVDALVRALDGKHMLIASFDPTVAAFARSRNWDGMLRQEAGDYLMVVDANLAALKTDSVMQRSVDYSLRPSGNDLIATVDLKYANHGSFTWKTTRYRTYTRLYVPAGSQLVSVTGNLANDKILDPKGTPGTVDTVDELGRRSFGTFISVEPGETRDLVFTYRLPSSIAASPASGTYDLLVQKQPGIGAVPLTLTLDFGKRVSRATPAEASSQWGDNLYRNSTDLAIDRQFEIGF
jgi:hypothetical protein